MAEDIKINEVQTVNDASCITVVLEDGSLGKRSKATVGAQNSRNFSGMNWKKHKLPALLMLMIVVYSCASMGTPDGGPYDEEPPK